MEHPLALDAISAPAVSDVKMVVADVSKYEELKTALEAIPEINNLSVVINNAGLAIGRDLFQDCEFGDWEMMIDTNVMGLLATTKTCLPHLLHQPLAHIVNIGSVAGRWVYPGGNVYSASKAAVQSLTEGLRLDLLGQNVRVTNIAPGMVETEFSVVRFGDRKVADEVYRGMTPLSAQDIAECIVWCLNRPEHVNVAEMVIYPTAQASVRDVSRG